MTSNQSSTYPSAEVEHVVVGPQGVRLADISYRMLTKLTISAIIVIAAVPLFKTLAPVLVTVAISLFLAIAADTVVRALQRRGVSRGWGVFIVIFGALFSATTLVFGVLGVVVTQSTDLARYAPTIISTIENSRFWEYLTREGNISSDSLKSVTGVLIDIPEFAVNAVSAFVGGVFSGITILFAVTFMLLGGDKILMLILRLVPRLSSDAGWRVVVGAYNNIGRYIVGATVQALAAGFSLTIVLLVLGVKYAVALGVIMFVMDYIPMVGATLGAIPALVVPAVSQDWSDLIVVLIFVAVYQQFENALIQPRIQGRVINMPGIAIFFSVLVGGQLMGVVGALLAVPVASIIGIVITEYLETVGRDELELPKMFDDRGNALHSH